MTGASLVPLGGVLSRPGVVTALGLTLPEGLAYDDWAPLGEMLARIGRWAPWAIGDWLNYGERAYGERYAQAMNLTGYDYQTLANMAWAAKRVAISLRKENLSFSHHLAVAPLTPALQERWLAEAAPLEGHDRPQMTVRELRQAVGSGAELSRPEPVWTDNGAWYERHCRRIQALAQQIIDGAVDKASVADAMVDEAMRIQERAKAAPRG